MIIFLYGPDTYRSKEKLNEIVLRYQNIHKSGLNYKLLDKESSSFDNFKEAVQSASMFSEKKLVVSKDLLEIREFSERFMEWGGKDSLVSLDDVICIFYEGNIVKTEKIVKWLVKNSQKQEFGLLSSMKLIEWVKKYIQAQGVSIDQAGLWRLVAYSGGDLWKLTSEIRKMKAYAGIEKITAQHLDMFLPRSGEKNIFSLVDAMAMKDKVQALRLLHNHIESGDEEMQIFSMLCRQFRIIAQVARLSLNNDSNANMHAIAKKIQVHPFVVKKSTQQASRIGAGEIKKIYNYLADSDLRIKTGEISPRQAMEFFVLR